MPQCLEKQRVGCALGGYFTALAIDGVLPILHAGPGCGASSQQFLGTLNGAQSGVYFNEGMLPSSNLGIKDVVFGGIEKIKNVTEQSIKMFDTDLIILMNGCTAEIIGDNLQEAANQFSDSGVDVLYAETAGFKGNNLYGHDRILEAIIEQYLKPVGEKNNKQVNVWGIIPYYDPFWLGTYNEIERLLTELGFEPNIIYGPGKGVNNVKKIPEAAFNLVLSPWWDLKTAQLLESKFNTPYFHYPIFPIGPTETKKFLLALAEYAKLDLKVVNNYIEKSETEYYYYEERTVNWLYDARRLPKHFITLANSVYTLGLAKYLVNDLGLIPDYQFITDDTPEEYQESIRKEFRNFEGGITAEVEFEPDAGAAMEKIRQIEHKSTKPFLLGSSWDDILALDINAYFLTVSAPISDRVILDRNYFGYRGAQRFFEDFYGKVSESVIHKGDVSSNQEYVHSMLHSFGF